MFVRYEISDMKRVSKTDVAYTKRFLFKKEVLLQHYRELLLFVLSFTE